MTSAKVIPNLFLVDRGAGISICHGCFEQLYISILYTAPLLSSEEGVYHVAVLKEAVGPIPAWQHRSKILLLYIQKKHQLHLIGRCRS